MKRTAVSWQPETTLAQFARSLAAPVQQIYLRLHGVSGGIRRLIRDQLVVW